MNKDNLGNTLSKEQIEYFKDSKVVDSAGNLLVCYHGTRKPGFTEFDARKGDSFFGEYKFGDYNINYFTTNKSVAVGYTEIGIEENGNVYACYVNIVNPFIVNNETISDIPSWNNVKDSRIRDRQILAFNKFWNKWNNKGDISYLGQINNDLRPFNCRLEPNEDDNDYYDLIELGNNSLYGGKHPVMYAYSIDELFEDDMYEEVRDALVGNIDDPDEKYDYYLTVDDIIKWVIHMNEEDNTNYDGIILADIHDTGPRGSWLDSETTDVVTLISSNQIKSITNKNPTNRNSINEDDNVENSKATQGTGKTYRIPSYLIRQLSKDYGRDNAYRQFMGWYKPVILPIKRLFDDNNLEKEKGMISDRRTHIWGKDVDRWSFNDYKNDWINEPIRVALIDNKYRILDGHHRIIALANDGYENVEVLLKQLNEKLLVNEAYSTIFDTIWVYVSDRINGGGWNQELTVINNSITDTLKDYKKTLGRGYWIEYQGPGRTHKANESLNEAKEDRQKFIDWLRLYFGYKELTDEEKDDYFLGGPQNNMNNTATKRASDMVDEYIKEKPRIPSPYNDFYWWMKNRRPDEFYNWIGWLRNNPSKNTIKKNKKGGADLVFTTSSGSKVYHITNYEAAEQYGKGTRWCISGNYGGHEDRGREHFNDYTSDSGLHCNVFFIMKPDNDKIAVLIDREDNALHSIWDAEDNHITGLNTIVKDKDIYEFLKDYDKNIGLDSEDFDNAEHILNRIKQSGIKLEDVIKLDDMLVDVAKDMDPFDYEYDPASISYIIDVLTRDPNDLISQMNDIINDWEDDEITKVCTDIKNEVKRLTTYKGKLIESKEDFEKFKKWIAQGLGYDHYHYWMGDEEDKQKGEEALEKAEEYIYKFKKLKSENRLENPYNDMYWWMDDMRTQQDFIHFIDERSSTESKQQKVKNVKDKYSYVAYEDDTWKVIRILDYTAMVYYGKGTKWCVSMTQKEGRTGWAWWNDYHRGIYENSEIYVFINKKTNRKYCLVKQTPTATMPGYGALVYTQEDISKYRIPNCPDIPGIYTNPPEELE